MAFLINIKRLRERGEVDYSEITTWELIKLKEHFDIIIDGDRRKVFLKTI